MIDEEKKRYRAQMGRPETDQSKVPPRISQPVIRKERIKPQAQSWETNVPGRGGFLETGKRIADRVLPEISVGGRTVVGGKPLFDGAFSPREASAATRTAPALQPAHEQDFLSRQGATNRLVVQDRISNPAPAVSSASPVSRMSSVADTPSRAAKAASEFSVPFSDAGFDLRSEALKSLGNNPDRAAFRQKVFELAGQQFPEGNQTWNGLRVNNEGATAIADALYEGPMSKDGRSAVFDDSYRVVGVDRSPTETVTRTGFNRGPSRFENGQLVRGEVTPYTYQDTQVAAGPQETSYYNPSKTGGDKFATEREARSGITDDSRMADAEIGKANAQASEARSEATLNSKIASGQVTKGAAKDKKWQGLPSGAEELFMRDTGEIDKAGLAEFAQYASATGEKDLVQAYSIYTEAKNRKIPPQALQRLAKNPELRDSFRELYGWLPYGY